MFEQWARRLVRVGDLRIRRDDGREIRLGDGSGEPVIIRLTGRGVRRLLRDMDVGFGEAWTEGDLSMVEGDLTALLALARRNLPDRLGGQPALRGPLSRLARMLGQWNDRVAARRNVAHHYDLTQDFYRLFLDEDLQYSCAFFEHPEMSLEAAQAAKKARIGAKLALAPGMRVLDIGCGFGGLALTLARDHGADVTGVTLSVEQLAVAQARARTHGGRQRPRFSLTDYRDVAGRFDRVVSVGMLEHVGAPNLTDYFRAVRARLTDDGVAVVHSIGRADGPGMTQEWIAKRIFPGGYIPALSEAVAAAERAGLWVTDVEILRLHYAETLRHWRERLVANREAVAARYDARFYRLWEFYLAISEFGFRERYQMVFQLQLARRVDALPMSRDYMVGDAGGWAVTQAA